MKFDKRLFMYTKFAKIFPSIITLSYLEIMNFILNKKICLATGIPIITFTSWSIIVTRWFLYIYNRVTLDNSRDICSRKSTRRMVHRRLWISFYSRRSRWNGRYKYRELANGTGETSSVYPHCVIVFLTLRRLDEGSVALTKI